MLQSLHSTLKFYIEILDELHLNRAVKVPNFAELSLPSTALRAPVTRKDKALDLLQVLQLLQEPLAPVPLGEDLRIRPQLFP